MEQKLQSMIDGLTFGTKVHVCIHDISGLLEHDSLRLRRENTIHSANLCDAAKMTGKGLRLCMKCKCMANEKAVRERKLFTGMCVNGLKEIILPVTLRGEVVCIIFVGNLFTDRRAAEEAIKRACRLTGADPEAVKDGLRSAEEACSLEPYLRIAELLRSYLIMLAADSPISSGGEKHWAVTACMNYIDAYYDRPVLLREIAALHFINEKYLGRLFKKQMGLSFHEYLNEVRLKKARELLLTTKAKMIDVALLAGFENVTYFNRMFRRSAGMTPSQYRALQNRNDLV